MPLETAPFINSLVSTNPADTDSEGQGSDHLRLIKSAILATFPNFTAAALNSTQAEIDAAVTATSTGAFKLGAGTVGAPALALAADATTGVYSAGAGKIDISIAGVQLLELNSAGLNLTAGTLQFSGVDVFPLQAPAYGAASIPGSAIEAATVDYANIQNVTADRLLGNPTGSAAAPSEVSLGAGLSFSGGTLIGTPTLANAANLKIVNDSTNPNTQVNITADEAVLSNFAGGSAYFSAVSVSVNTTTTGAGAMGAGSGARAANQEYHWWLISNGSVVNALGSKQTTYAGLVSAGDLPSGYTFAYHLGGNFTDGSSNLRRVLQVGKKARYVVTASTNTATLFVMANTTMSNNPVSVNTFMPTTAVEIYGVGMNPYQAASLTMTVAPNASYGTITSQGGSPPFEWNTAFEMSFGFEMMLESRNIYVTLPSNSPQGSISCGGWREA